MALRYLLDTNIFIYIAKQKPIGVLRKFERLKIGSVGMSIITYGELMYGANKSHFPEKTMNFLEELATLIKIISLPVNVANWYGEIRNSLEKQGKSIGNNDLWIVSHALAAKLILVTNNVKELSRILQLKIENWVN